MKPEIFHGTALQLADIEAREIHFMGAFEAAEVEMNEEDFQSKFDERNNHPDDIDLTENPVVQRCQEFCREQFQCEQWKLRCLSLIIILISPLAVTNEEVNNSMNDSQELAITEAQMATNDPFTKRPLREPLVNRMCDHIYEKATIFELLESNRRVRCPVVGCRNREHISKSHLEDDPYVRAQLRIAQSNTAAAGSDEELDNETIQDTEFVQVNESAIEEAED